MCVRSTLRLRPQLPATVRNRPREVAMAVPMASFEIVVTFGGFRRRVASCCVADIAFWDIPTCFITCQKSLCGRRNTLASLPEDELQFSCKAQHFGDLHRHFAWQARRFGRVASRVFWRHGANRVAGVAFCEMC